MLADIQMISQDEVYTNRTCSILGRNLCIWQEPEMLRSRHTTRPHARLVMLSCACKEGATRRICRGIAAKNTCKTSFESIRKSPSNIHLAGKLRKVRGSCLPSLVSYAQNVVSIPGSVKLGHWKTSDWIPQVSENFETLSSCKGREFHQHIHHENLAPDTAKHVGKLILSFFVNSSINTTS